MSSMPLLYPSSAPLMHNSLVAVLALLTPAECFGLAAVLGLIIGSFLSVVVYRTPIMLHRAWDRELHALTHGPVQEPIPRAASKLASQPVSGPASESPSESASQLVPQPASEPFPQPILQPVAHHHQAAAATASDSGTDASRHTPPIRFNLCVPRSSCTECGHPIQVWENIPVLSYVVLRGRCSACHTPIGMIYPLLEILTGLVAVLCLWRFGLSWQMLGGFGLGATLLALGFIDARTRLLPDVITLPLLWAGLLVNLGHVFTTPESAILGAAAGYASLWLVYWAFRLATGKEGIGYGDFKLFAALGAWLGWQALPSILLIAAVAGAVAGIAALLSGRVKRDEPLPFGPFLAAAAGWALLGNTLWIASWLGN